MAVVAFTIGVLLVTVALADLVNTLVATVTSPSRWWPTAVLYRVSWRAVGGLARRIPDERRRERVLGVYPPVSVLVLLGMWVALQILGFGFLWWSVGGLEGATGGIGDALYFSGVVYFTLGFGEIVPAEVVPRIGVLVEAFSGVLTTALVIGYLPALYSAYAERERQLLTLDDGTEERITPASLLIARTPGGDLAPLLSFFTDWERWVAGVMETHTTFPMLRTFRSKHSGQSWVTALGLVTDAAMLCQIIVGASDRAPYWCLRRSIQLMGQLTEDADLEAYRTRFDAAYIDEHLFDDQYSALAAAGFDLLPRQEAHAIARSLRPKFDARLEHLIDHLLAPRGFWGHAIGHRMGSVPDLEPAPPPGHDGPDPSEDAADVEA